MTRREVLLGMAALAQARAQEEAGFAPVGGWTVVDGPESAFTIEGGEIAVSGTASFPTWLRSGREYENFELRGEFFVKGWTDSGLYLHAPEHGRPSQAGMQIKVFHQKEDRPTPQSMGAILPVVAPRRINVRDGWNELRVWMDWPALRVWTNGELVQDVNLEAAPELRRRLRRGYFGIVAASAPCRFRGLRVKEMPGGQMWEPLYAKPEDFEANWAVSEGQPDFLALGETLRADGLGHLATKARYRDFELRMYVRAANQHNAGVLFRCSGRGLPGSKHYEIQLHNVEEAHFPTGSLYHYKRAKYPRIEDEKWYLFELRVQGRKCDVRIDGETVMEYDALENLDEGFIELQAHRRGYWTEFKRIEVRRL